MFSGLVREVAEVKSFKNNILEILSSYRPTIGDSIAINGACLTVIELFSNGFSLNLTTHTQEKIAVENLKEKVHIEPALKMSDRLDGHLVQGHIDGIAILSEIEKSSSQTRFFLKLPPHLHHLMVVDGSVCVDGISLTISDFQAPYLILTLIPHTFTQTLFHTYKVGRRLNIESDMIVRSIAKLMGKMQKGDWERFDRLTLGY
ncbi:riboflavin synthase [uncultured Helicobacter sp.]|uniref:riboflavin synthase n=1 Tax=uncultured Helicobacter sp. TaxID=175537 RepID=UPI002638C342|nr:riboflavin synthase [uncultured Helicobacter sp.]